LPMKKLHRRAETGEDGLSAGGARPCTSAWVDEEKCREISETLSRIQLHPDPFIRKPRDSEQKRREAEYWFYMIAVCHATRTLEGFVNGEWLRGNDYLLLAARRRLDADPSYFDAERMARISGRDLRAVISDDGDPFHSKLDRIQERVELLHGCAEVLLRDFEGDVMKIYARSGGYVKPVEGQGLLDLLARFKAYSDPVRKKSFLLVAFLNEAGVWRVRDPENLSLAIDYHLMRIALRSGAIRILDRSLAAKLKERKPVTESEDEAVREAARAAYQFTARQPGLNVFSLDSLLWNIGRTCCFYEHDPICGNQSCWKQSQCTLLKRTDYMCPGRCPLDGVCLGSRDPEQRRYWETNIHTEYY